MTKTTIDKLLDYYDRLRNPSDYSMLEQQAADAFTVDEVESFKEWFDLMLSTFVEELNVHEIKLAEDSEIIDFLKTSDDEQIVEFRNNCEEDYEDLKEELAEYLVDEDYDEEE